VTDRAQRRHRARRIEGRPGAAPIHGRGAGAGLRAGAGRAGVDGRAHGGRAVGVGRTGDRGPGAGRAGPLAGGGRRETGAGIGDGRGGQRLL